MVNEAAKRLQQKTTSFIQGMIAAKTNEDSAAVVSILKNSNGFGAMEPLLAGLQPKVQLRRNTTNWGNTIFC